MQYFCHIKFCKRLHMSHSTKLCKSRRLSLLHPIFSVASLLFLSPHIFSKGLTIVLMFLRYRNDSEVSDQKQVQSLPALPSSYQKLSQSCFFFLTKLILRVPLNTECIRTNTFYVVYRALFGSGRSQAVVFKGKDVAAPLALMRGLMNLVLQVNA